MMPSPSTSPSTGATAAARPPSRVPAWFGDRWVQGIAAGTLTLVPVRRYPEWLRQAIMWVPAAAAATVMVTPQVWESMAETARESAAQQEQEHNRGESQPIAREQPRQECKPPLTLRRKAALWSIGVAAGASVYGSMRFSLWADGAIEDRLRGLGVARPRVVMAVLGGLVTVATGGAPEQQRPRVGTAEG